MGSISTFVRTEYRRSRADEDLMDVSANHCKGRWEGEMEGMLRKSSLTT